MIQIAQFDSISVGDIVKEPDTTSLPLRVSGKTAHIIALHRGNERHGYSSSKFDDMKFVLIESTPEKQS